MTSARFAERSGGVERGKGRRPAVERSKSRVGHGGLRCRNARFTSIKRVRCIPKLASGGRVTNGELVTAKLIRPDGGVELTDGRVLDKDFREFLSGYAVTSYGSQGKTVDYVLFSDSTVKTATNAQQWYVTISRGRRGIRIFTPDKEQLRENVTRSGHRPPALELAPRGVPWRGVRLWDRLHGYLLRFGRHAANNFCRLKLSRRRHQPIETHEHKITRMLVERPERSRGQNRTVG